LWLLRNVDIDGIYLDGAPYERTTLRRLRAALEPLVAHRPSPFLLDLHASCAGNPHLPYAELYPYIDSIWFGEQCDYASYSPEQWLAEVSGIPFGLQGQVLGDNSVQWKALVFGMTCRIYPDPMRCNPRPLWGAIDRLGLGRPHILGWWDRASPVSVSSHGNSSAAHVRASLFYYGATFAIAVANWAPHPVRFTFGLLWPKLRKLGLPAGAERTRLRAPAIHGFQSGGEWDVEESLVLGAAGAGLNEGYLLHLVT